MGSLDELERLDVVLERAKLADGADGLRLTLSYGAKREPVSLGPVEISAARYTASVSTTYRGTAPDPLESALRLVDPVVVPAQEGAVVIVYVFDQAVVLEVEAP